LIALVGMNLRQFNNHFRWRVVAMSALALASAQFLLSALGQGQEIGSGPGPASSSRLDYYRDPAQAPPSWAEFAKLVKYRFETWISADETVANRFRAYLTGHAGKDDGPPQTLTVRAWLNPDGTVERVSFPPLNDTQADEDLHTILKRGNIGEAPPPEMLQPLNLRFSLNLK
jgi:hypothetical protein